METGNDINKVKKLHFQITFMNNKIANHKTKVRMGNAILKLFSLTINLKGYEFNSLILI